jgi:site-specific DNA-methyltransferase (adenine-specific)
LKPGGYMLAFGGSRTYHRLACAVEDAGFEIRDCIMWLYGSGFPKGKGCLKPAHEPIILARKPGKRVLPLGIDECRVECETGDRPDRKIAPNGVPKFNGSKYAGDEYSLSMPAESLAHPAGRWPANIVHDGSDEVLEAFAEFGESKGGTFRVNEAEEVTGENVHEGYKRPGRSCLTHKIAGQVRQFGDTGTAARFFYTAKASRKERGEGNNHPTVKPLALMRWLAWLVARVGETVLDPFGGSGTTAVACQQEGRECIIVEKEAAYVEMIRKRTAEADKDIPLFAG